MAEYRIYKLDENGRIAGAPSVDVFAHDAEATAAAETLLAQVPAVEVWRRDRRIVTLTRR